MHPNVDPLFIYKYSTPLGDLELVPERIVSQYLLFGMTITRLGQNKHSTPDSICVA